MSRSKGLRYACALAVMIVGAAACTKDSGSPTATASKTPAPETAFTTRGGDTWSWSQKLTGTTKCSSVSMLVNGEAADTPVKVSGGRFSFPMHLRPGINKVVADCGSGGGSSAPVTFNERLTEAPQANISVSVQGSTVILDGAKSKPARDASLSKSGGSPIKSYKWGPDPRHPDHLTTAAGALLTHSSGKELRLQAPSADGEYYVSLQVTDSKGRTDRSVTYFEVKNGAPRVVDMTREHPAWINKAVIYAPIPALMGGGPESVMRKLLYLKKLGVDALWLWPPATLRTLGEEYAIDDYYKLDPDWEPESDFKKMVDKAHELGMHVMIDFVPNHMSAASPYYQDTKKNGKASRYWDFFDRKANGEPTHYFDWTNLPNLNYDNPEVRNMIIGAAEHWVRDMGIDGFRVDAAWGVKKRRPSFWPEFRSALKRINPDLLLLAEASAVDPYYFSHGFDLAYDWSHDLGQWAWTSAFGFPQEAGTLLKGALTNGGDGYAPNARIMRFLNNNDTGARFVDQFGVGLTRVAATMQFTLPGVPEMFTGDEIGASYEPYSNLTPIQWKDPHHLEPLYRRLIELRHTVPALTSLGMNLLDSNTDSVLGYVRPVPLPGGGTTTGVGAGEPVLVILNYGEKTKVTFDSSPALDAFLGAGAGTAHDLISHKTEQLGASSGSITVTVPKETPLVLAPGAG